MSPASQLRTPWVVGGNERRYVSRRKIIALLHIQVVSLQISKNLAIRAFAYAREAERSVDYSCRGEGQWGLFQEYYAPTKQAGLREVVNQLKPLIPSAPPVLERQRFSKFVVPWFLLRPFAVLARQQKTTWRFPLDEIVFLHQTFQCLIEMLPLQPAPPSLTLINLRMDFWTCQYLIRRRLYGVPQIEQATRIEHFCQPEHIQHTKLEDLLERDKEGVPGIAVEDANAGQAIPSSPKNRVA
jgi:hypothetical protein